MELKNREGQCVNRASLRFACGPSSALLCDAMQECMGRCGRRRGKGCAVRLFFWPPPRSHPLRARLLTMMARVLEEKRGGGERELLCSLSLSSNRRVFPTHPLPPPRCRHPHRCSSASAFLQTRTVVLFANRLMTFLPLVDVHNVICTFGEPQRR